MKSKIFVCIIIFITTIMIFNINYAARIDEGPYTPGVFHPEDYRPDSMTEVQGGTRLQSMGNTVIGFLRTIGSIVSVAVLAILGIKYMFGSVEEKAGYKETMRPYVIGAVLVFGITNLLAIFTNLIPSLIK